MLEAVLVDGYNVLHAIPRFAPRGGDLAEARESFERWLAQAAARQRVAESVVVWDGRRGSRTATRQSRRLVVLYTEPSMTADERILELCRGPYAGRADVTWVVSSDRDVQGPARQLGFTAIGAMTFYRRWSSSVPSSGRPRSSGAEANPRSTRTEVDELLGELLSRREDSQGGES